MDERNDIFKASAKVISRLQLMAFFFGDELVYKIFIRTQIIEKLFKDDAELDFHKLDLFHVQYTETVIDLLNKIKKGNEKNVTVALDEINYNDRLISNVQEELNAGRNFHNAAKAQTELISTALNNLYQNLSGFSMNPPFDRNITEFGKQYADDYYQEISVDLFYDLTAFDPAEVYKNGYAIIEKKLMGWQCKRNFNNLFIGGLKCNQLFIEIYKLKETDDFFIIYPDRSLFLDLQFEKLQSLNFEIPLSKSEKLLKSLSERNVFLKNAMPQVKINIPSQVQDLLSEYHMKISALDFIDDEFDVEANVLKAMLNTK